jgi:hypothetical protein
MSGQDRTPSRRRARAERGQNLIEFALIVPVVLLFVTAIVMMGLALFARSSLQQAVREGAREAAVGATLAQVQGLAAGNAPDQIDPEDVRWCHPAGSANVGDPVRVYIREDGAADTGIAFAIAPVDSIFAVFGASAPAIRLDPQATARLEKSASSVLPCE